MHYGWDPQGWYIGEVPADSSRSTPDVPPGLDVSVVSGAMRARRYRVGWRLEPFEALPVVVPDEVDMWRCHYVLIAQGKMAAVRAAIEAIEDPTERELVSVQFEYRATVRRLSVLTQQLQQAAGITDEERDAMFIAAAAL